MFCSPAPRLKHCIQHSFPGILSFRKYSLVAYYVAETLPGIWYKWWITLKCLESSKRLLEIWCVAPVKFVKTQIPGSYPQRFFLSKFENEAQSARVAGSQSLRGWSTNRPCVRVDQSRTITHFAWQGDSASFIHSEPASSFYSDSPLSYCFYYLSFLHNCLCGVYFHISEF